MDDLVRVPRPAAAGRADGDGSSALRSMGMQGVSKSQVSRLCGELDERVGASLNRPIEGEWPYLWLDATCVKARHDGHVVPVAVIAAVAVDTDGRREMLGTAVGNSEAEPFWTEFLRSLAAAFAASSWSSPTPRRD